MGVKILVLVQLMFVVQTTARGQEPRCYSSFDFQEKLLEKMVVLTNKVEAFETQLAKRLVELTDASEKFQEDKFVVDSYFAKLEKNLEDKLGAKAKLTDDKVEKIEQKIKDSIKPSVAFLAKAVSDTSPGTNTKLKFSQTLLNTDNSYSTSTGEFIAPVEGTYWFSVQLCGNTKKYVNFRIYVNDDMMSDTQQYDPDSAYSCTSSNTVAILMKGDKVYVKTGLNTSTGKAIGNGNYRWSMFMGSLVN